MASATAGRVCSCIIVYRWIHSGVPLVILVWFSVLFYINRVVCLFRVCGKCKWIKWDQCEPFYDASNHFSASVLKLLVLVRGASDFECCTPTSLC